MRPLLKFLLVFGCCALLGVVYFAARKPSAMWPGMGSQPVEAASLVPAPAAPADAEPAAGLPEVPPGAVVFDLHYRAQTGGKDDVSYRSFWGFGASDTANHSFLQEVAAQAGNLSRVHHAMLDGRPWSAVEHEGRRFVAFYFDLNADGKFSADERIPPTRKVDDQSLEFITPDFVLKGGDGPDARPDTLFRVLLHASFYPGNREPSFMWSPACLLEGTATLNGKPARMILFAEGFRGVFDRFGSSSCALLLGETTLDSNRYLPRERLSSLVGCDGQFYRVKLEGRRSRGHVARAVLTRDTSPTGTLEVKLVSTNALQTTLYSVYLQGVEDRTVFFNVTDAHAQLPIGSYSLERGDVAYGLASPGEWAFSFSSGPQAILRAGEPAVVALGGPTLEVRAVHERDRYNPEAKGAAVFAKGSTVYLEPRILGQGQEVLSRFQHRTGGSERMEYAPPTVRITAADGKEVLAKTMEYG